MATALNATITGNVAASLTKAFDLSSAVDTCNIQQSDTFAFGNGVDQANDHYHDEVTVGAGGRVDIDLAGAVNDPFGDAIAATAIKAMMFRNLSATPGDDIQVFGNASGTPIASPVAALGDGVILRSEGMLLMCAPNNGYAVTGGVADIVELANGGGNPIDVDVFFLLVV